MKIYHPEGSSQTLMVSPGTQNPETSDFMEGGKAKRFDVHFIAGVAEVPSNLGLWLVQHGFAHRTALKRVTNSLIRALA